MTRGVAVGKFLPPHLGHSYLIEQALAGCDQLTVMVIDRQEYSISAKLRQQWLQAMHPKACVVIVHDTLDDNDSPGWARHTIKFLGYTPDVVFSSEAYGERWAKAMGCRHVLVDKARRVVPISGTEVRADPWKNWKYLHPVVRAYFCRRFCIVGAESTGTTTLAKALAKHYCTTWVPEYGHDYTLENWDKLEQAGWQTADFVKIADEQNRREDEAAQSADKLLICDTDAFATGVWHERYMGGRNYGVEARAIGRRYDLYLLTDVNIPFEQDGIRDGEHLRQWMHQRFQDKLRFWDRPFVIVRGTPEQRLAQAIKLVDLIINEDAVRLPGITRDAWHPVGGF